MSRFFNKAPLALLMVAFLTGCEVTFGIRPKSSSSSSVSSDLSSSSSIETPTSEATSNIDLSSEPSSSEITTLITSEESISLSSESTSVISSTTRMHIVTFDTNGGSPIDPQEIEHGEKARKPSDPSKEGYDFIEWVDEDGERWVFNGYSITSDITLYAVWHKTAPVIRFVNDDGSLLYEAICSYGEMATYPYEDPTPSNIEDGYIYTFIGWDKPLLAIEDETVTALYEQQRGYFYQYLDDDGSLIYKETIPMGDALDHEPSDPSKPSTEEYEYRFLGWEEESDEYSSTFHATYEMSSTGLVMRVKNNAMSIVGYKGNGHHVYIPSLYKGKEVTEIYAGAFMDHEYIESVYIPASITSISSSSFRGCSALTSLIIDEDNPIYDSRDNCNAVIETSANKLVVGCNASIIPDTVTVIGDYSFMSCNELTSITIPNSVTKIGGSAFSKCANLSSLYIPASVRMISDYAFSRCPALSSISVDINNSIYDSRDNCNGIIITSSNRMILGCSNSVIPASVTQLYYTFYGCSSLTSMEIPDSVNTIYGAFKECTALSTITLPSSLTRISDAFDHCANLISIELPSSLTYIGNSTFAHCDALESIYIPNKVSTIETFAFDSCYSLSSIVVDSNNRYFDSRENCNAIIKTSNNELLVGCLSTIIPTSVTSIGMWAFYGSKMTSLTIPASITTIKTGAFANCSSLVSINVDPNNTKYDSRDACNAVIEKSSKKLLVGCMNSTIPSTVTSIDEYAFRNCNGLTSLYIPASVTSIDAVAFVGCTGLTSITVAPNNNTYNSNSNCNAIIASSSNELIVGCINTTIPSVVRSIGHYAFSYLGVLEEIIIPATVTSIDYYAFYGSSNLARVYYEGDPSQYEALNIHFYNSELFNADIFFYSENPPVDDHYAYWHYASGTKEIVLW